MNTSRNVIHWRDAWSPVSELRHELDRLFGDWTGAERGGARGEIAAVPPCDVLETEEQFLLTLETPGIRAEDMTLEIDGNVLTLSGERRSEIPKDTAATRYSERVAGKFLRSFRLPQGVDAEKIGASTRDGILRITVPKAASAKARRIAISRGGSEVIDAAS